jgi:hypothetical protein
MAPLVSRESSRRLWRQEADSEFSTVAAVASSSSQRVPLAHRGYARAIMAPPLPASPRAPTEDHMWFEDWWMVASLCDECLTTLCGLILG